MDMLTDTSATRGASRIVKEAPVEGTERRPRRKIVSRSGMRKGANMKTLIIPVHLRFDYDDAGGIDWPKTLDIDLPDGDILPANTTEDMDAIRSHIWLTGGFLDMAKEIVTEIRDGRGYEVEKELE